MPPSLNKFGPRFERGNDTFRQMVAESCTPPDACGKGVVQVWYFCDFFFFFLCKRIPNMGINK